MVVVILCIFWACGSVFDVDCEAVPLEKRNGFTFINPDEQVSSSKLLD